MADQGPLAESSVLSLAAGLAEALGAIHAAGLVHRDLKPDNVLLAYDGPRVIDFGIARVAGASTLTGTGVLMGTLAYMSPEQAIGQSVGPPSDVFSLASVLVFAATGRGPYGDGTQAELLYRVAHQMPSLDGVPPQVRALVEPCMAPEPDRRPTTSDLIQHLGGARPAVGWLRTETIAAIGPDDTASMTAQQPQLGQPSGAGPPVGSGRTWESGRPVGVGRPWGRAARRGRAGRGSRAARRGQAGRQARRRCRASGRRVAPAGPGGGSPPSSRPRSWWSALPSASASASSAATTRPPPAWSGGQRIDTAAGLTSVSCASADFCAAADSGGNALTYSGGSWSAAQHAQQQRAVMDVLPDGRLLRGHQQRQPPVHVLGRQVVAADRAVRRQRQPAHLTSVSCAAATFCMATGNMHAYKYSGGTWDRGVLVEQQQQADRDFVRVGRVLRRRRFGRECLYLLGQLVVRRPAGSPPPR